MYRLLQKLLTMESRVTGNCHARFGAGENLEITSKGYLSLKASTLWSRHRDGAHRSP